MHHSVPRRHYPLDLGQNFVAAHERCNGGNDVLEWFRAQVHAAGGGNHQSLINAALREYMTQQREPLEATLRRVVREELGRETG